MQRPDRDRNTLRCIRWGPLRQPVALSQADELRPLGIRNDELDLAADLQVTPGPVRIGDRQRDGRLDLPVAVFAPPGRGGQPQILAVETDPGWVHLRSAVG